MYMQKATERRGIERKINRRKSTKKKTYKKYILKCILIRFLAVILLVLYVANAILGDLIKVPSFLYTEKFESIRVLEEREIATYLEEFSEDNWELLNEKEKKKLVKKFEKSILKHLNIYEDVKIKYFIELFSNSKTLLGFYSDNKNAVSINEVHYSGMDIAHTVAHECRHAWQHRFAKNCNDEFAVAIQKNMDSYVRASEDYEKYKNQLVEEDANQYADYIVALKENNSVEKETNIITERIYSIYSLLCNLMFMVTSIPYFERIKNFIIIFILLEIIDFF